MIQIEGLSFYRGERPIFKEVSLSIPRGKIVAIMGPSGTGKTTLLKLIAAQIKPDSGRVFVNGKDIHQQSRSHLLDMRKRMGMLFQNGALFTNLTVFDNVAFPYKEHTSLSKRMIADLVMMKLEVVGLRGAANLYPRELSGGMARRVALARAIALDPELIMYDEPFAGQDPISMGVILKLIKALNETLGLTSIIVSHDVHETAEIADEVFILADHVLYPVGSTEKMFTDTTPIVDQFVHGSHDGPIPFHFPADPYYEALMS